MNFCRDCKHCRPFHIGSMDDRIRYGACHHPDSPRDPVTGNRMTCSAMRRYGTCGLPGFLFEPISPKQEHCLGKIGCGTYVGVILAIAAILALVVYMGGVA